MKRAFTLTDHMRPDWRDAVRMALGAGLPGVFDLESLLDRIGQCDRDAP